MAKRWRNRRHVVGSGTYFIRGIKFVDGVAQDGPEVTESIAEFFKIIGVELEDAPSEGSDEPQAVETPEDDASVPEAVETPEETPAAEKPKNPRTRK